MNRNELWAKYHNFDFDEKFDELNLDYKPWVGKNYLKGIGGKKIFVLGLSHYKWDDPNCEKTIKKNDFIRDVIIFYHGMSNSDSPTFRNFEEAWFNKNKSEVSDEERKQFWTSVCFNNYIQRPLSNNGENLTEEDRRKGFEKLKPILSLLKPDIVFTWSTDYEYSIGSMLTIAVENSHKEHPKIGSATPKTFKINLDNHIISIIALHHPSRMFDYSTRSRWHQEFIQPALNE